MSSKDASKDKEDEYRKLGDSTNPSMIRALATSDVDPSTIVETANAVIVIDQEVHNFLVPDALKKRDMTGASKAERKAWAAEKEPYIQKMKDVCTKSDDPEVEAEREKIREQVIESFKARFMWQPYNEGKTNLPRFRVNGRGCKTLFLTGMVPEEENSECPRIASFEPYVNKDNPSKKADKTSPTCKLSISNQVGPYCLFLQAWYRFNADAPALAENRQEKEDTLAAKLKWTSNRDLFLRCGASPPETFVIKKDGKEKTVEAKWRSSMSCDAKPEHKYIAIIPTGTKQPSPEEVQLLLPRTGTIAEQRKVPHPLLAAAHGTTKGVPKILNIEHKPYDEFERGDRVMLAFMLTSQSISRDASDPEAPSYIGGRMRVISIAQNGSSGDEIDTTDMNTAMAAAFGDDDDSDDEEMEGGGGDEPKAEEPKAEGPKAEEVKEPKVEEPKIEAKGEGGEDSDVDSVAVEPERPRTELPELPDEEGVEVGKKRSEPDSGSDSDSGSGSGSGSDGSGSGSGSDSESEDEAKKPSPKKPRTTRRGARRS